MMKKIALVTGGYSGEAAVSYKSAVNVANSIDREKYEVYTIDIQPSGWFYTNTNGAKTTVNKDNFSIIEKGQTLHFDAVLIIMHGTPGEDGKLQGYFDMLKIPYTSCDAATSAITFNKRYTVAVAAFGGISVAKSLHLFKHSPQTPTAILAQLSLPVFVKPNNGGSSIGMSKVDKADELQPALEKAFKEDDQVLVEEFISGREFTIGVFKSRGQIHVLPITEIITHNAFFDYEAKYLGKSEEITPANITDAVRSQLETAASKVYEILNCRGVVRIDFIYNEENQTPYMLEVNTIPGQTDASVIPQQVKALGRSLKDFYSDIIEEAFQY
jgi:D-alanine-D-alanine ligase